MELSKDDVQKLAALARLRLTDEESVKYQAELGDILVHVERLGQYMQGKTVELDRDVVTDASDLRPDTPIAPKTQSERQLLLDAAREVRDNQIVVPAVFKDQA